jgi:hypothetical protein
MSSSDLIKQFVLGRRKPNLTRQEFHDYHYKVHGELSVATSKDEIPLKYYQTHFFDAAYHAVKSEKPGPPNWNHPWAFYNDSTELYFSSPAHLGAVFGSDHVRSRVGPDAFNFADFGAANALFCREYDVPGLLDCNSFDKNADPQEGLVAQLWVQGNAYEEDGDNIMAMLAKNLMDAVHKYAAQEIHRVVVSARAPDSMGLLKYFNLSDEIPKYAGVFTLYLRDLKTIALVRKIQTEFEEKSEQVGLLQLENVFIAFGKRVRVFDMGRNLPFDESRQPDVVYSTL